MDLASQLAGHRSAAALLEGGRRVSYAELSELVLRTAAGLGELGLPARARIAVAADATVDGVVAYLGVQAAGLLPVMISSRSPAAELERRFAEAEPVAVALGTRDPIEVPGGLPVYRPAGSSADDLPSADAAPIAPRPRSADDPAVVLYTSGVSGDARPVVLSHGNLAATSRGLIDGPGGGIGPSTVCLCAMPLAHVFGLNSILGTVLRGGGKVVLSDDTDPELLGELLARHRVTMFSAVPIMWKSMIQLGERSLFETVTRASYSAAPMPPALLAEVQDALGLTIVGGFGMTETAGTICLDDAHDPSFGSLGRPLGGNECRVVEHGADVEPGDYGSLLVRGPSVTSSYLDGSAVPTDDDGWFRTGDLATIDDEGRMTIVDREKDVINIGGFNVSPAEVESALSQHPAVASSVVVGDIEGDREIVVAHVELIDASATSEQLTEHCREFLSRYKVPSRILVHDELPRTDAGKAVRRLLARA